MKKGISSTSETISAPWHIQGTAIWLGPGLQFTLKVSYMFKSSLGWSRKESGWKTENYSKSRISAAGRPGLEKNQDGKLKIFLSVGSGAGGLEKNQDGKLRIILSPGFRRPGGRV